MTISDDNPFAPPAFPPPSSPPAQSFPPPSDAAFPSASFGEKEPTLLGYGPPTGPPTIGVPTEQIAPPLAPTNRSARQAVRLGVLSLVLTPVVGIAAVVLGRRARMEIGLTGGRGSGLATAGIWMGGVFSILWLLGVAFLIAMRAGSIAG